MYDDFTIRPVQDSEGDLALLNRFCHELAEYDGHKSHATPEKLRNGLFKSTSTHAVFGLHKGEPIGFLIGYESFSVYQGSRGLYITGVYIVPAHRHAGHGRELMHYIARYAREQGLEFLNWMLESDNRDAAAFYAKLGADRHDGWSYCRIAGEKLEALAGSTPSPSRKGAG